MRHAWPAVLAAAEDRRSGAAEIARAAAAALGGVNQQRVPRAIEILLRGHPSMAPLWRLATDVLWGPGNPALAARRFLSVMDRDAEAPALLAAALPDSVLTISWSSAVAEAVRRRRPALLVCMRSEPGGEGRRTAEELREAAGSVRLLDDAEALERLPADAVAVGADAVTPEGVVNKVGTAALARAATERQIPCYVVAGETKFVADMLPEAPPFESTPLNLFTAIATPDGMLPTNEARRHARSRPVHPDLRALLEELGGGPA